MAVADNDGPALIRLVFGNTSNNVLLMKVHGALADAEQRIVAGGRVIEVR